MPVLWPYCFRGNTLPYIQELCLIDVVKLYNYYLLLGLFTMQCYSAVVYVMTSWPAVIYVMSLCMCVCVFVTNVWHGLRSYRTWYFFSTPYGFSWDPFKPTILLITPSLDCLTVLTISAWCAARRIRLSKHSDIPTQAISALKSSWPA